MKFISRFRQTHMLFALALIAIGAVFAPLCAWEILDTYAASGNRTTGYWPTSNEMIYVVAIAPASGSAVSQFIQGTTHRATASAVNGATACDHGMIYSNWTISQLETSATVNSGVAKSYGFNASSSYYKDRVFCSFQQD